MAQLLSVQDLRERIKEIDELGTLPHVMTRILEVTSDETAGAPELGSVIAQDHSLTSKLMKVANSAFYGRHGGVADVRQAVVVLGFEEIRRLALGVSVLDMFTAGEQHSAHRLQFWRHCLNTAVLAELIDRERGRTSQGAFTAGLLHDVGRVVLDQHLPDIYCQLLENEAETGRLPAVVEQELIGAEHGRIGFWLAERWRFPMPLAEAIRFHHQPSSALGEPELTAVVHMADALVHRFRADAEPPEPPREIHPTALAKLGLVPSQVDRYRGAVDQSQEIGEALARSLLFTDE